MVKNLKKFIVLTLIAAIIITPMNTAQCQASTSFSNAVYYTFGTKQDGFIAKEWDTNYYELELPSSGAIDLTFNAEMEKVNLAIYDSDGEAIWNEYCYWNSTLEMIKTNRTVNLTGGTYYFCVAQVSSYSGNFDFTITHNPSNESFAENYQIRDNTLNLANAIDYKMKYNGQLAMNDEKDFYKFTVETSGSVEMEFSAQIEKLVLLIYDTNGNELWNSYEYYNNTTKLITARYWFDLIGGTYYFCVQRNTGYYGNYNFEFTFETASESFREDGAESNNMMNSASVINTDTAYNGQIAINDEKDFYTFTLTKNMTVKFNFTALMDKVGLFLYDSRGNEIWSSYEYFDNVTYEISVLKDITLLSGSYYLCIQQLSGKTGDYTFCIVKPVAETKITSLTTASKTVTAKWSAVRGCTGYEVQYSSDKYFDSNDKIIMVNNNSLAYKIKKLKKGKTYYVRVCAYVFVNDKYYWGPWSSYKYIKCK